MVQCLKEGVIVKSTFSYKENSAKRFKNNFLSIPNYKANSTLFIVVFTWLTIRANYM